MMTNNGVVGTNFDLRGYATTTLRAGVAQCTLTTLSCLWLACSWSWASCACWIVAVMLAAAIWQLPTHDQHQVPIPHEIRARRAVVLRWSNVLMPVSYLFVGLYAGLTGLPSGTLASPFDWMCVAAALCACLAYAPRVWTAQRWLRGQR